MSGIAAGGPPGEPAENPAQAATRAFVDHRGLLFSVVYNMLGSVADTEDVLQETWLAWVARAQAASGGQITSPRAYLVRIAVNRALAGQASISRRREDYAGPWLPEPLITGDQPGDSAETVVRGESVSIALLVVLETLTPLERAVFVLHDVFGYPHTEIAGILDRSPPAIRQLAHRARKHVQARRPSSPATPSGTPSRICASATATSTANPQHCCCRAPPPACSYPSTSSPTATRSAASTSSPTRQAVRPQLNTEDADALSITGPHGGSASRQELLRRNTYPVTATAK